jgi:hypothetical protein
MRLSESEKKKIRDFVKANHEKMTVVEMASALGCIGATVYKYMHELGIAINPRKSFTADEDQRIRQAVKDRTALKELARSMIRPAQSLRLRADKLGLNTAKVWPVRERTASVQSRIEKKLGRMLKPEERLVFIDGNKRSKDLDNICVCSSKQQLLEVNGSLKAAAADAVKKGVIVFDKKKMRYICK